MKHIVKILALVVAITVLWIGLLQTSVISHSYTWLVGLHVIICLIFYFLLGFREKMVFGWGGSVSNGVACSCACRFPIKGDCWQLNSNLSLISKVL